jgi:multisubunit Na+/H+ antiporter MnhB subunit
MLHGRVMWRKISNICEATAKVLAGVSSVLAFAATSFEHPSLAFVAGCTNTVGLVLLLFGNYSSKESQERTHQLNAILAAVGVTPMPDISVDVSGGPDVPARR